jgi:alpha-galactosidase
MQTWFKPLQNGDWAVCFLNRSQSPKNISIDWKQLIVNDDLSGSVLNATKITYQLRDLWAKSNAGTTAKIFNATLPGHDVILLRLSKMFVLK